MKLGGKVGSGAAKEVKICIQPICFPRSSDLWINRGCLLGLGAEKSMSLSREIRRGSSVGSTVGGSRGLVKAAEGVLL